MISLQITCSYTEMPGDGTTDRAKRHYTKQQVFPRPPGNGSLSPASTICMTCQLPAGYGQPVPAVGRTPITYSGTTANGWLRVPTVPTFDKSDLPYRSPLPTPRG